MPAQGTGIRKDDKVHVVAVDPVTGEISELTGLSKDSAVIQESLEGTVPVSQLSEGNQKVVESMHSALESLQGKESRILLGSDVSGVSNSTTNLTNSNIASVVPGTAASSGNAGLQVVSLDSATSNVGSIRVASSGKRANNSGSPVVTKVIITKNPNTSQPQAVPVQLNQIGGEGYSLSSLPSNVSVISQLQQQPGSKTPTKTITISQKGIVSPGVQMATVTPGTPPKLPISKLPMSPARTTPTKITMIPVTVGKSPQKIAPATSGFTVLCNSATNISLPVHSTITMSPSKVISKPGGTVHLVTQKAIQPAAQTIVIPNKTQSGGQQVKQLTMPVGSNVQQIHVPGNKFHYIRLAAPQSSQVKASASGTKPIIPAGQAPTQMKIAIPAGQAGTQVATSRVGSGTSVQRILLPAQPNQVQIRPAPPTSMAATSTQIIRTALPTGSGNLSQIAAAPGTSFIQAGGNVSGVQGYALVPASYLSQMQLKPSAPATQTPTPAPTQVAVATQARQEQYVPIASSNPALSASAQGRNNMNGSPIEATGARPRKPCNCTKSQCLKLYCDCFANGEFCHNCNCMNCANNLEHEEERSRAIKSCLDRNPLAFHPKIGKGKAGEKDRRHNKGCNCKRSGCLKNYCECYEAKIMCGSSCKCIGCKNFEESPERKTLMHLADAAEVRVQQQTAAKTKLSSQISDLPSRPPVSSITGERLPFSFVTGEVAEATCACLLAQAEEAERLKMPPVVQERMVIEEFGRCLLQIIDSANKTKVQSQEDGT